MTAHSYLILCGRQEAADHTDVPGTGHNARALRHGGLGGGAGFGSGGLFVRSDDD